MNDLPSARLGVGSHSLHRMLSHSSRQQYLRLAFDLGVRHFDTAPSYGAGLAEREIGRFARNRRPSVVLASKFGIAPGRWMSVLPGGPHLAAIAGRLLQVSHLRRSGSRTPIRDYSVAAMKCSVEASLRRLQTDYLDILFLHAPVAGALGDGERLARALEALREAGKVRRFGLSGDVHHCGAIARDYPAIAEVLQIEVSIGPDGLLTPVSIPPRTAIVSWEFRSSAARLSEPIVQAALRRLALTVPTGVVLVSTCHARVLRMAADLLSR